MGDKSSLGWELGIGVVAKVEGYFDFDSYGFFFLFFRTEDGDNEGLADVINEGSILGAKDIEPEGLEEWSKLMPIIGPEEGWNDGNKNCS